MKIQTEETIKRLEKLGYLFSRDLSIFLNRYLRLQEPEKQHLIQFFTIIISICLNFIIITLQIIYIINIIISHFYILAQVFVYNLNYNKLHMINK